MIYSDNLVITESIDDLNRLFQEYNCSSADELADLLYYSYGISLLDKSEGSEYLQVEAQKSQDFYNESITESDNVSRQEYLQAYISND